MEIIKEQMNNLIVLDLKGRVDLASGMELKEMAKEFVESDQTTYLLLNMHYVDFVNSSGLGVLITILKNIRVNNKRLALSNLAPYVKEIIELCQLDKVFTIYTTEDEAVSDMNNWIS